MKSNVLSILFVIVKSKINKKGLCPIRCRLTYEGKRKVFSTGQMIQPDQWDSKSQLASFSKENSIINNHLEVIRHKIQESYLKLKVQNESLLLHDIYNDYKGISLKKEKGTIEMFHLHNERMRKLVGIDIKQITYSKYLESKKHLGDFIFWKYQKKDLNINTLKSVFLTNYEYYLKTEKSLQQSTINKAIQRFRKVIKFAIAEDYLNKDPFILYKPVVKKKEIVFLTRKELEIIVEFNLSQKRLQQVKDMFVFCCYSGLPYNEMSRLQPHHIVVGFDKNKWIEIVREKTGRPLAIPLLPKAAEIILKYEGTEFCFPPISNQKFNSYLKELADIMDIPKRMTHHMARRTFATTVLLYNDVPMEIVSELLGHSKMATTQLSYGKVMSKTISRHIKILEKKL